MRPTNSAPPWWDTAAEGPLTAYEDAADYAEAKDEDLLTNATLRAIVGRMEIDLDRLFAPDGVCDPALFDDQPGGAPLGGLETALSQ